MSDRYFERVVALQQRLIEDARTPTGDQELQARLTLPRPEEATYTPPPAQVVTRTVPGPEGGVTVRVYRPLTAGTGRPLLVWCHGGAFLGGDLDMPEADAVARELTVGADAVVVSVDYRLCLGGVHYPAPSDDLIAAVLWTLEHAEGFGADPARIAIGGASAGACLAAGAALRLRDDGVPPASLVLAYPIVHPVLPPPSDELAGKLAGLSPAMAFAPEVIEPVMENFLGRASSAAPAYATPGVAKDLRGHPPTLIINCEYDGLRASGEAYAGQLLDDGVEVRTVLARGVAHGHLNRPALPETGRGLRDIGDWITCHRLTGRGEH